MRVTEENFISVVRELSTVYELNEGSIKTTKFRPFKDDELNPPLGIQFTVINSEFDFFWKFRNCLLANKQYKADYNKLKKQFQGESMESYREAKNDFILRIMKTPEFNNLKDES